MKIKEQVKTWTAMPNLIIVYLLEIFKCLPFIGIFLGLIYLVRWNGTRLNWPFEVFTYFCFYSLLYLVLRVAMQLTKVPISRIDLAWMYFPVRTELVENYFRTRENQENFTFLSKLYFYRFNSSSLVGAGFFNKIQGFGQILSWFVAMIVLEFNLACAFAFFTLYLMVIMYRYEVLAVFECREDSLIVKELSTGRILYEIPWGILTVRDPSILKNRRVLFLEIEKEELTRIQSWESYYDISQYHEIRKTLENRIYENKSGS